MFHTSNCDKLLQQNDTQRTVKFYVISKSDNSPAPNLNILHDKKMFATRSVYLYQKPSVTFLKNAPFVFAIRGIE